VFICDSSLFEPTPYLHDQGFVRLWETLELRPVCELRDPRFTAAVRALAITPDETNLITGDDGALIPARACVCVCVKHISFLSRLTRFADGRIVCWGRR
jgi:hypothetical protein